jgi:hypothetical protein
MAGEKNGDLIEAMIAPRAPRRPHEPAMAAEPPSNPEEPVTSESGEASETREPKEPAVASPRPSKHPEFEGRLEVRPIGTSLGFRELAALHKRTWKMLNVEEKQVHMLLWRLAIHFGLYVVKPGQEKRRPALIGAFWARSLADSPLTLGHLYPPQIFKGLLASEVFEFGGMVIDPNYQGKGLVKMMSDTARLFVFSRRPKLIITNPVEPLYEMYKQLGLKTVGRAPIEHPHAYNVKVWLMYAKFDEMAKPYFM